MHKSKNLRPTLYSFIWKFMRRQWVVFTIIFLVSLVWAIDVTVWPYLLGMVINILTQFDADRAAAWAALTGPLFFGLFLWIAIQVGFCIQGFLLARAKPQLEADIRMEMFDHVQHHSPKYFNEHFAGSLANKITDMTTQVSMILDVTLTIFIPTLASCFLAVFFFYKINPLFVLVLGAWVIMHFATCMFFASKCDNYENVHGEVRSKLIGKIVDSFTNNFAVNLFYRFVQEKRGLAVTQREEQQKNVSAKRYVEWMRLSLGLLTFVIGGVVINSFMIHLWLRGKLTTGEIAQVFNMTWNIIMILWISSFEIPVFFQSVGIAKQALKLMHDPQDVVDLPGAKPLIIAQGEIRFEGVSFQYGEKKLFRDQHVHIRGGEKVGLVGYSGAGKSTFVNLILRFFPVDTGKILIDQQNIAEITLESLRNQITLIPQDPLLFHRTLAENICFGKPQATEKEMIAAAKLAHCDEFIRKCPNGYESLVGERGTKLSGGERQRIAIARAMLADSPILILDEATSSLDSVTEKYIQESLEKLMQKRTTIVIAHRLSTLSKMDRLLVFDQGEIVEEGTHESLLAEGGRYAKMWQMQVGGFLPDSPQNH